MKRILTGIQSTGTPHLGNILGAIIPAINLSKIENNESLRVNKKNDLLFRFLICFFWSKYCIILLNQFWKILQIKDKIVLKIKQKV